jgi:putative (di)nucleoside polyphosphate hydrolase
LKPKLRENVVAVFLNKQGLVLVGHRSDREGVWQLPQGGVDEGESKEIAVIREASEEVGVLEPSIEKRGDREISYEFPKDFAAPIAKHWDGQRQTWFILKMKDGDTPDLSRADGEFTELDWWSIEDVLDKIIDWKKESYHEGFKSLGLL